MALQETQIETIDRILSSAPGTDVGMRLRSELAGILVTGCDEEDMGNERPFRSAERYHLHLVDGSGHCWNITSDPAKATSILLARRRKTR